MSTKSNIDLSKDGFSDALDGKKVAHRYDREYMDAYRHALETKVSWAIDELEELIEEHKTFCKWEEE